MTKIESDKVEISISALTIYNSLSDFNNFKKLMPEQVSNWSSTKDECSFTINGMAPLGMKIVERKPYSEIRIVSHGKIPLIFDLKVLLTEIGENKTMAQLIFESKLNPMMKMMLEKPLSNFFNMLAGKLKDIKV